MCDIVGVGGQADCLIPKEANISYFATSIRGIILNYVNMLCSQSWNYKVFPITIIPRLLQAYNKQYVY